MEMGGELGFFAEKATSDELAMELVEQLRPGDEALILLCSATAPVSRKRMRAIRSDGPSVEDGVKYESLRIPRVVSHAVDAVRAASYRGGVLGRGSVRSSR